MNNNHKPYVKCVTIFKQNYCHTWDKVCFLFSTFFHFFLYVHRFGDTKSVYNFENNIL